MRATVVLRIEALLNAANVARWAELNAPSPSQARAAKAAADRAMKEITTHER